MSQPTSRSTIKAIACSKPTISENLSKWKHNGIIADRCKQRWALCHIGLAKDRGDRLVNQPRLSLFDKCWETTVGDQISIMKREQKTNECRTWWKFFSPTFFSEFDERKNFEIRVPRPKKGPLSERQRWADQRQCQANFWLAKILTSRHLHRTHAQSRDEHGSGWMSPEANFWRIRTGSECNFFEIWRMWNASDSEKFCCFNVIILKVSKILVVIRFHRFAKWYCIFCHQMQKCYWDYFAIGTVSTFGHL